MDGFRYSAAYFKQAEEIVNDLEQKYSNEIENISSRIEGKIPYDFEYKSQLQGIIANFRFTGMELREFQRKIENTRQMLAEIDSSFSYKSVNIPLEDNIEVESKWYQDIGKAYSDSGAAIVNGVKTFFSGGGYGDLKDALVDTGATIFVMNGSILSGLFKIGEFAVDSIIFVAGSAIAGATWISDQFTGDNKASEIMDMTLDQIRRNLVGEVNEKFYQNTTVGSSINDRSNFKYDSAGAQTITKVTELTAKAVGAVALTVASGGIAAPLVIGSILGVGSSSEVYAQGVDREVGEEYNYLEAEGRALAGGVAGATEFYSYGLMGSGIITAGKALSTAIANGSRVNAGKMAGNFINYFKNINGMDLKTFTSSFAKKFFCADTAIFSLSTVTDHGINWAFGDETTEDLIKYGGTELGFALGLNAVSAGLGAMVKGIDTFNAKNWFKDVHSSIRNDRAFSYLSSDISDFYGINQGALESLVKYKRLNNNWLTSKESLRAFLIKANPTISKTQLNKTMRRLIYDNSISSRSNKKIIEYITQNTGSYEQALKVYNDSFKMIKSDYYEHMVGKYIKMGLSEDEALAYLLRIDEVGACTYAARANVIAAYFKDKPEQFKEYFGFDLYREVDGKMVFNSEELLADLYTFINTKSNIPDAKLLDIVDGKLKILSEDASEQIYIAKRLSPTDDYMREYLKSKSINFDFIDGNTAYKPETAPFNIWSDSNNLSTPEFTDRVKSLIDEDYCIQLQVYTSKNKKFTFYNPDGSVNVTTNDWFEGGGHAVFVTGITDTDIIVSSWGERLTIPISEFKGNDFNLMWSKIISSDPL